MRHELTTEQIDFYQENGFLVIENFLNADELEEWRRCTDESVEERLGTSVEHMTNQLDPSNFYARVFTQCLRLADSHPGMRKLVHDPKIGKMATLLAGVDGMRIWHDQALIKHRPETLPRGTSMSPTGHLTHGTRFRFGSRWTMPPSRTVVCGIYPAPIKLHALITSASVKT